MKTAARAAGMTLLLLGLPLLLAFLSSDHSWAGIGAPLLAIFLGELVGFSEIISRYRDEPLRAAFNWYGGAYFAINGVLAWVAFVVLNTSHNTFPTLSGHPYSTAVFAGFGAMAIFRSKLFVFRSDDGKEFPVGPDIVLSSVLKIVDRKIDRQRAARRQQLVFSKATEIAGLIGSDADFDVAANFLVVSMSSFQNLSDAEKQQIAGAADRLKKDLVGVPNLYKAMTLGFALLDITGEESFADIVSDLEAYLKQTTQSGTRATEAAGDPGASSAPVP
ncbi:MAG: hypothetical protein WA655_11925 [Candidatus Korobacteraceae bacterium]